MDTPKPKPRRKRRCAREGCKRGVRDEYRCCSYLCNVVTDRIEPAAHGADNGVRWRQAGKLPPRPAHAKRGTRIGAPLDVCLNQWL
jgi:hypothetical protein